MENFKLSICFMEKQASESLCVTMAEEYIGAAFRKQLDKAYKSIGHPMSLLILSLVCKKISIYKHMQ